MRSEQATMVGMELSRQLRREYREACRRTDELFAIVKPEALFERPVPERHRLNFYIGHVEAFDWNMICTYGLAMDPIRADFNELFAFGIDPDSSDLPTDVPADWPSLEETASYCHSVRRVVGSSLAHVDEALARVCIEHRLMHAETLCYLLHNLDPSRKRAPTARGSGTLQLKDEPTAADQWIAIPAGTAELGRDPRSGFGWDNEFGEHSVAVPEFEIAKHKVTNGEYLAVVQQGAEPPHYWRRSGNRWMLRTMFGESPLPLDWPVYVTHVQARRFVEHAGSALPSEAQWIRAAHGSVNGANESSVSGERGPRPGQGNYDFVRWDPCAVGSTPGSDSAFGVSQLVGNGWEWTSDLLRPFPGFREFPFYPGYSSNFFDDEHYVLRGGSPRTALPLLRRTFRNWFREGYPYAYSTFRAVRK